MACCPRPILTPLVKDCEGNIIKLPADALFRVGTELIGGIWKFVNKDTELTENSYVFADASAGGFTIVMPPAKWGLVVNIKKIDQTRNPVIVDGFGSETIDGVTDFRITLQYESWTMVSDGTQWFIV